MSHLYNDILNKKTSVSVVGLGYVGMPLAIAFGKKVSVVGFDTNINKINKYKDGIDVTNEVGDKAVKESEVFFTFDEEVLNKCKFHIVAVPTPINNDKTPDLRPVTGASKIIGRNLSKGSIVVFESTVYPGVTEDICVPILEKESGLVCGKDFKVGYSPERINPGDKVNRLESIIKIVSGMDEESLEIIAKTYELVIDAGVYRAENIKVAEAAKVIENSQRDVNIAFINELSTIFNEMGIDTAAVINAASTKWNFIKLNPGLVGGHCIGVDPYYLIHRAKELGVKSRIIEYAREVNDGMAKFVVENTIKQLIKANKKVKECKVAVLGLTFKEDCPDIRNSKVIDIINGLKDYDVDVLVCDPIANKKEVEEEYNINLINIEEMVGVDCVMVAVSHSVYREMSFNKINEMYYLENNNENLLIDIKGIFKEKVDLNTINYWSL